jgi:hypothetical protein
MLSSASRVIAGLAATSGIASFALPLVAPWYLLTVLVAATTVAVASNGRQRIPVGVVAFVTVILVLQGHLSAPFATACFSAAALAMNSRYALAVSVLTLNLSPAASATEMLADLLYLGNLEAAAPSMLAALALILASNTRHLYFVSGGSGLAALALVWLIGRVVSVPEAGLAMGAIPVMFAAAVLGTTTPASRRAVVPIGVVMVAALATWVLTPPKTSEETWLLLPEAPESYEAKYFSNYLEALRFAGINAKQATSAGEIPVDATVLMPWMTAGFPEESRIGDLARERQWTVLLAGEHTNEGDVATRVETMATKKLLRRDLSVPRGNTDKSGQMRVPEISGWPPGAILNRGASVIINSLTDKILLTGDGWWAEPNIGEWLWVGDYVWRQSERSGRLPMAAASDIKGARWVVLGDNSPLINRQLIADPRAAIRILESATLWPAFWHDTLLAVLAVVILIGVNPIVVILLPIATIVGIWAVNQPSQAWRDLYIGESGFDERSFNNTVSDNPALVNGRRLIRLKMPYSGEMVLPNGPSTIFMLVDGTAEIGGVRLDGCHRLGSFKASEGPYLMDAQACRITGRARILIGTHEAAAAIAIPNGAAETIVILDVVFLGQKAPASNSAWLITEISP